MVVRLFIVEYFYNKYTTNKNWINMNNKGYTMNYNE